jgi:glycosyltransferase involved in cell wall biosynthesis
VKLGIAHNWYRSDVPSGANTVVEREVSLLQAAGLAPMLLYRRSDDLIASSLRAKLRAALSLHGSRRTVTELRELLRDSGITVLHAHNVWPLFTYGLFEAAKELGIPTLQTLHNNRLIASNTHFYSPSGARRARSGDEREFLRRLIVQRPGRAMNWLYTRAYDRYWRRGVPLACVDRYICLTEFQRSLIAKAGVPAEKLLIKPNFIDHHGPVGAGPGDFALFVGRLSAEKGIAELCHSWQRTGLPLKIIGSGPLAHSLPRSKDIILLGAKSPSEVLEHMAAARFLVMNSTCYETFGLVLVEALASGTPCLVPELGGMPEIVANGRCGLTFSPGDSASLVAKARQLWDSAPNMRAACRNEYLARYSAERNLAMLTDIYRELERPSLARAVPAAS